MKNIEYDVVIVGGGPVGLMCAYLGTLCGLKTLVLDQAEGPLKEGRADALNARTLQLLQLVGCFEELYAIGKNCNTSSVWSEGRFVSRQSKWWDELQGCEHKHFLMLGQSYLEQLLDKKLKNLNSVVKRRTQVMDLVVERDFCMTKTSTGETFLSRYVIAADGSRSIIRNLLGIAFDIQRPQIVWAVVDAVISTTFPKVPEIIVFQTDTSDVAWIPREKDLDRFYVRMDKKDFGFEEVLSKINRALSPHTVEIQELRWFSSFSVKESVAEKFSVQGRVFLAGDACHIHSVNGGQGLNTGLGDAFNLMWKLSRVLKEQSPVSLLDSYEVERKAVAKSVIESSGVLVRSTKYSETGTHAMDYVRNVEKWAGNITGMGISYGDGTLIGQRVYDFKLEKDGKTRSLYSLLKYSSSTLLVFSSHKASLDFEIPEDVQVFYVFPKQTEGEYWAESGYYSDQVLLVRPDSYIERVWSLNDFASRPAGIRRSCLT